MLGSGPWFSVDAIYLVRSFYLLTSALLVSIYSATPPGSNRLLTYGARAQNGNKKSKRGGFPERVIDFIADVTVPHSWFTSFYLFSIACGIFCAYQVITQGTAFEYVTFHGEISREDFPTPLQILLAWTCLFFQGFRRLTESLLAPSSTSRMAAVHWLVGIAFYLVTNLAVWCETNPTLMHWQLSIMGHEPGKLWPLMPNFTLLKKIGILTGLLLFVLGSVTQAIAHSHLRSLRRDGRYAMPTHWLFKYTLTPHYFAECLIYLGIAMIDAPKFHAVSTSMFCCLIFVVVNLGITADGTRQWYAGKFGEAEVRTRSRMIPGVW